jgi:hypothetical protein
MKEADVRALSAVWSLSNAKRTSRGLCCKSGCDPLEILRDLAWFNHREGAPVSLAGLLRRAGT